MFWKAHWTCLNKPDPRTKLTLQLNIQKDSHGNDQFSYILCYCKLFVFTKGTYEEEGKETCSFWVGRKKKVSCHWTHILIKTCSSCSSLTDNILKNNWPKEFLTKLGHECMEHWKNLKTNQTCLLWFMYNGIQETVSLGFSLFDLPAKKYNHVVVFSTRAPIVNFLFYFLHTSGSCCCSNADLEFLVSVKASFKLCDSWLKNPKL